MSSLLTWAQGPSPPDPFQRVLVLIVEDCFSGLAR